MFTSEGTNSDEGKTNVPMERCYSTFSMFEEEKQEEPMKFCFGFRKGEYSKRKGKESLDLTPRKYPYLKA